MNGEQQIWILISRKMAGEASPADLTALETLLQSHPELRAAVDLLTAEWNDPLIPTAQPENAYDRHLLRMTRLNTQKLAMAKRDRKRRIKDFFSFNAGVFLSYFRVIYRNLYRFKSFSIINISGLAIGMASAILILLLVQNEMSFDQFHVKKDRIYMAWNRDSFHGEIESWSSTPMPLAPVLKASYPQVEEVSRVNGTGPIVISVNDKHLEVHGNIVDDAFLRIFSYPLLRGNAANALSSPRSIVLTESFAKTLFGNDAPMGRLVRVDSNANFIVTGIVRDLPINTEFDFQYLLPWSYMKEVGWENMNWNSTSSLTVLLLKPGVTEAAANRRLRDVVKTHSTGQTNEIFLHPMNKWRLYSRFENGKIAGGEIENIRMYAIIAGFILLIACINYMNLSTARSVKRGKEVGIRKVVGASRGSIVWRFLGESISICCLAVIVCLVMVQFGIEGFNWLTENKLYVPFHNPYFWLSIFSFALITGLIAGSYPAFYLSTFRPISVLKGTFKTSYHLVSVRKILVVLQFSFAITFVICTIVMYNQIKFGTNRNPGYNRDHLAFVYMKGAMNKEYAAIRNDLLQSGAIISVTRSNSPICYTWNGDDKYTWTGWRPDKKTWIAEFHIDNDFTQTMGLKIVAGRDINTLKYPSDSTGILLNESAVQLMGFKNPIGQLVRNDKQSWTVVGVIKDFVSNSPFNSPPPMLLQGPKSTFGVITFRLNNQHALAENMQKAESIIQKYIPGYPVISAFVDKADNRKFDGERRAAIQSAVFGGLAILISCMGLFALAAYTAENRIKEIGIRKVLGASVAGITMLLSREFVKLVIISFVISSPVAWWLMHSWLEHYAYRVNIGWWIFGITGFASVLIAVATVSFQAIKAAIASPIVSLRAE